VNATNHILNRRRDRTEFANLESTHRAPGTPVKQRSRSWLGSTLVPALLVTAGGGTFLSAAPIQFAGQNAELVLSEVSERTIRVQLFAIDASNEPQPPESSTVLIPFVQTEKFRARELSVEQELRIAGLRVTVTSPPLAVSLRRADGKLVQELRFDNGASTNAGVAFRTGATVLGLGEGAQQFDRRGALYPMEPSWGGWNRPVLGSVVPSPYLIGTEGWALFAHRPEGQFDLRGDQGRFIPRRAARGLASLDLFVIDVREPAEALTEYVRLTGRPVMPPKWALGYFQSHRTLANPEEPRQIARAFREKKLPCDALIYLGTGYCTNGWNTGHGSLAFNTNAFVPENIRTLHDLNFKIVLHVNRAPRTLFGAFSDPSPPAVSANRSLPESQQNEGRGRSQHIRDYWERHRELLLLGVDGWWPDDGDELPLESRLARHRCYFEGPLEDRSTVRPWSLHRTGYAGAQRYGGWIWSGDIDGKWETLAAHISIGLNHGLSLTPFWGSDTGGFYPTPELTGELYARWFQFSAFCPSFRSHGRTWKLRLPWGWNTGEFGPIEHPVRQHPPASELHNPAIEPICRKFLELRYRLLPYNYTLARNACDTGLPMMRALWLHYPDDAEAVKLGNQYLWGRDLLVAPVVEKNAAKRRVYLPDGPWLDWWTGQKHAGRQWIEREVDLATLPLYVRAGAIVPLDPVRQFTAEQVSEPTTLRIHPGANGLFTLYDDDGQSLGYRDGSDAQIVWIRFRWDDAARRLTIERDERMRHWTGVRDFVIEMAGGRAPSKRVTFKGERLEVLL
jgi:alpha-glucosidase (family GH31 glycosyl hydrolase)